MRFRRHGAGELRDGTRLVDYSPAPLSTGHGRGFVVSPPTTPAPSADEPAPPLAFTWGDLAELWTLLHLNPTSANASTRRLIDAEFIHAFGESLTLDDIMSMYDREPNFEETFTVGDRMVLTGLRYVGQINTKHGPAQKVLISACTRESYPNSITYSALGQGFAALAQNSTPADFPHVVEYVRVRLPSGNDVKRFAPVPDLVGKEGCREFIQGNDGGPVIIEHADATPTDAANATPNAPTVDF